MGKIIEKIRNLFSKFVCKPKEKEEPKAEKKPD